MRNDPPDGTEAILYEEAVRAIKSQARQLEELRSRTAILLAAATVIAGFLGQAGIKDGVGLAGAVAVIVFGIAACLCVWVLLPRFDAWTFVTSPRILIEDHVDVPQRNSRAQFHRFLAERIEAHFDSNMAKLHELYLAFWWSAVAVSVDVGLWLLELAVN